MQEVETLLTMIAATQQNECDCAAVDSIMEEVAERMAQGVDMRAMRPDILHHLTLCTCCQSELQALMAILASAESPSTREETP